MAENKNGGGKLPPKPLPPLPPGDRPPTYSTAELQAHFEYHRIQEEKMLSVFTVDHLDSIVKEVKAPSIKGAPQSQFIAISIASLIASNKEWRENTKIKAMLKETKERQKEWLSIRKHILKISKAQSQQIIYFEQRPYFSQEAIEFRKAFLTKLEAFSSAMDEIQPWLFLIRSKGQGQHGPAFLKSVPLAADIFVKLAKAYGEIGITNVSKTKRYEIVQKCMARAGESATSDAVKKAIEKHLKSYPTTLND